LPKGEAGEGDGEGEVFKKVIKYKQNFDIGEGVEKEESNRWY
jgi:hypothetical protein